MVEKNSEKNSEVENILGKMAENSVPKIVKPLVRQAKEIIATPKENVFPLPYSDYYYTLGRYHGYRGEAMICQFGDDLNNAGRYLDGYLFGDQLRRKEERSDKLVFCLLIIAALAGTVWVYKVVTK